MWQQFESLSYIYGLFQKINQKSCSKAEKKVACLIHAPNDSYFQDYAQFFTWGNATYLAKHVICILHLGLFIYSSSPKRYVLLLITLYRKKKGSKKLQEQLCISKPTELWQPPQRDQSFVVLPSYFLLIVTHSKETQKPLPFIDNSSFSIRRRRVAIECSSPFSNEML